MNKKAISAIVLILLLTGVISSVFAVRPVKAPGVEGTIYIREDGSIYPPDAPIQRDGDIYTLTDNISDCIVVQRSNIVLDGAGYTLRTYGLMLEWVENVMVKSLNIEACQTGIGLYGSYVTISNNTLINNRYGIYANWTTGNVITGNSFISNSIGLAFCGDVNTIYHNNFVNNTNNVDLYLVSTNNQWDDGYPSGGNYWSDDEGVDEFSGPAQDRPGSDGIYDTPYVMDELNVDLYPLVTPCVQPPPLPTPTPPVASFTVSATTVYTGEIIQFDGSSSYDPDGVIISYFWDFGDGHTGHWWGSPHSYFENGTYKVTLTVTDNQGLRGTDFQYITVLNRPPVAIFTESAEVVSPGENINFSASQSYDPDGFIIAYFWDFGDGSTATGVYACHAYSDEGTYSVTLTVTDNDGATSSASATKIVGNLPPIASFTESAETVYTGETIHFDASSSFDPDGTIVSYYWDFGDGTTATGIVVEHTYVDDGNYLVTLKVTDDDGATSNANAAKTVLNRSPFASFIENATTMLTGEAICFDASGSYDPDGVIVDYLWDFGDGNSASGIIVNHAYADDGIYTVTLEVVDDDGASASSTSTKTILNRAPVALFSESAETAPTGEVITFNATLSYDPDGIIVVYLWEFGDGAYISGERAVVYRAYADNGTYQVTLVVTDDDGATASTTSTKSILNRPPVVHFTETADTVFTGNPITFDAGSSYDPDGYITSYSWDFGDGTNANGLTVSHFYVENGTYVVTLTVMDDDGATNLASSTKTVLNRPPSALFTENATSVLTGETIRFNASNSFDADGTIVSYYWDFGDGFTVTGLVANHAYTDDGTYTVTLTVTDNDGETDSCDATKTVLNRSPIASFTESAETVNVGEPITFDASSSFDADGTIVSYYWDFGDGFDAYAVVANHAYEADGIYTVTLSVEDDDGATAQMTATKTVLKAPTASFSWAPLLPTVGESVTFDASASKPNGGAIVKYEWNLGDGGHAAGNRVTYAYALVGTYNVELKITDSEGLWDIEQKQLVLNVVLPPDLTVSSPDISFSDFNPSQGQPITISASVHNIGEGNAHNCIVHFFDADTLIGEKPISSISHHSHATASIEWQAVEEGFHLIKVVVDPANHIAETDEENNKATRSVLVGRLLGYGGIEVAPEFNLYVSHPNCWVTVSGTAMYNLVYECPTGVCTRTEPVAGADVTVAINGQEGQWETHTLSTGSWGVALFAPGSPAEYTVTVEITDYTFWKKVEYQLTVTEWPEDPGGEPAEGVDLTIMQRSYPQIHFDPSKPVENDNVLITAQIFNVGTISAADVLVNFYEGDVLVGQGTIDSIPAYEDRSMSIWWKASTAGMHTITVRVDPYNTIVELNEGNNDGSREIYVYPAWPDLTPMMNARSFSDNTPAVNQLITIPATVTNIGGVDADDVLVRFFDNDTYIGKHAIPWVPGKHSSRTALISHSFLTPGLHILRVVVDPEDSIIEATEDNNEYSLGIYVHLPSIDLTFPSYVDPDVQWDIMLSKSAPTAGDVITISCRILNVGELEAYNVVIEFLDTDTQIDTAHISSILADSSEMVSASWTATPIGWHRIRVIIDPDNAIDESNENNNVATRNVYVHPLVVPSDLYIYSEDIVFSNTNPDPGEEVAVYATVHNEGPESALNVPVVFLVDDTQVGFATISLLPVDENETLQTDWIAFRHANGSHVVKVVIDPGYTIYDPFRFDNNATRAIIVGMPPLTPPVASFTFSPCKPIIGEEIVFDASSSHALNGERLSYAWDFGDSFTGQGVGAIHSFLSEDSFTVSLTVTSSTGATASIDRTVVVTENWTFAVIADLHIGFGYPDYGEEGYSDHAGQDYFLTNRLSGIVDQIRGDPSIHFVVVLGDIANRAEYSAFLKAREILNRLNDPNGDGDRSDCIPYIPLIGNHDVWPYTQKPRIPWFHIHPDLPDFPIPLTNLEKADVATSALGDQYFEEVFWEQNRENVENIKKFFGTSWQRQVEDLAYVGYPYRQNYAFTYKSVKFIALDFIERKEDSYDPEFHPETELWLRGSLEGAGSTILLSHHPMIYSDLLGLVDFNILDAWEIRGILDASDRNLLANFAGHNHDTDEVPSWMNLIGIKVVTTEAGMRESTWWDPGARTGHNIRIVTMSREGMVDYERLKKIPEDDNLPATSYFTYDAKNPAWFHAYPYDPEGKEERCTYVWDFGTPDVLPSTKRHVKRSFPFQGDYTVTLTVTDDGGAETAFSRAITVPERSHPWARLLLGSPADMIVTDPEGFTVSKDVGEVSGMSYAEIDLDGDGELEDEVTIWVCKTGDYLITVIPEADAAPTDTYTLEVSGLDAMVILADHRQIAEIPPEPYVLSSTALDIPPTTSLDIGEPKFETDEATYVTSATPIGLIAEDNSGGSGVATTVYRVYNATYDRGWIMYTQPFNLCGLSDGTYHIDFNSADNTGNIELTNKVTIVLDNTPPTTSLIIGEPKFMTGITYVTFETQFTLETSDSMGSGVYSTAYKVFNSTYDSGWLSYTAPFYLTALTDGVYTIEYNSADNVNNLEPSHVTTIILDSTAPSITVLNPPVGWALQDGVTFLGSIVDLGSGVLSMSFSIREADDGDGIPIGFENLPVSYDPSTGAWSFSFDTLLIPDGYYVLCVEAEDNLGNSASTTGPYSIRNWAVIELLPSSEDNKAGRTMPVKFALRVAAEVDPDQPFVYNEELRIEICTTENPTDILQESYFGDTARDYRISGVLYITNFKTLRTPHGYTVTVYKDVLDVGSFTFETTK